MQIQSVFGQTETAHSLNVNMSLCKSTQQVALYMEKLNYSFRELRGQSSIVIKNMSLGITWSKDDNKMPSNRFWRQSEPSS